MQRSLFIRLTLAFIVAVIVGTLSHECGHYAAARFYGHDSAHIYYSSTGYGHSVLDSKADMLEQRQEYDNAHGIAFDTKELNTLHVEIKRQYLVITAAGPLETLISGTIGLILLIIYRHRFFNARRLNVGQWSIIFLAMFWLRPAFNSVLALGKLIAGVVKPHSDEFKLERYLGLPHWSLNAITGAIGISIFFVIVTRYIPYTQRKTFLTASVVGGIAGFVIWFVLLGPVLMH